MTLPDLVERIESQFPTADYRIESVIDRKQAIGTRDVVLEVHVWPPGRTLKARGVTPDDVWRQLEAPAVSDFHQRLADLDPKRLARRERA